MKQILFGLLLSTTLFSCKENVQPTNVEIEQVHTIVDSIPHYQIVKAVKENNVTSTDYEYKWDVWNGKLRQQPVVTSEMKYYIIYTDGTNVETTKDKGMFYTKGDTITTYSYIYK